MCTTSDLKGQPQIPQRTSLRLGRQQIYSLMLDSSTAAYVVYYLYYNPSYLNPWNLQNVRLWLLGFAAIRLGIVFYDHLVVLLIEKCLRSKFLPTRQPGAPPVRYVSLDSRSIVYLSLNSFNEYAFVMRLTHYLWSGGHQRLLTWRMNGITPWNTIIALGIMFVSMDVLYAPLHHTLHMPKLYPLIHKHHHRQHFPTRGYLDAGNEHPIEHMIGVMCTWFAVCVAEVLLPSCGLWLERVKGSGFSGFLNSDGVAWTQGGGVHALTVLVFFQLHAALAMLNHSPYDVRFSLPVVGSSCLFTSEFKLPFRLDKMTRAGNWLLWIITGRWFKYSVGHHEMHHRKFNYNYGQYCMIYDLWMGTFLEYEGPVSAAELEARKRTKLKGN